MVLAVTYAVGNISTKSKFLQASPLNLLIQTGQTDEWLYSVIYPPPGGGGYTVMNVWQIQPFWTVVVRW